MSSKFFAHNYVGLPGLADFLNYQRIRRPDIIGPHIELALLETVKSM